MTTQERQTFMEIWLKTMMEKMPNQRDKIYKKSFSTIALFLLRKTALTTLLGPFGFVVEDIVKFGAETLYTAGKTWLQIQQPFTTSYVIEKTSSDILVVRNTDPSNLSSFPLRLPEYAEIPISNLRTPIKPTFTPIYNSLSSARSVDSNKIIVDVWKS
jgi:hypothetical protein